MVVVPVGKHDVRHAGKVKPHAARVFERTGGIPRVQQDNGFLRFQQIACGRFAEIIAVDVGVVVHEDGQLHVVHSCIWIVVCMGDLLLQHPTPLPPFPGEGGHDF